MVSLTPLQLTDLHKSTLAIDNFDCFNLNFCAQVTLVSEVSKIHIINEVESCKIVQVASECPSPDA